MARNRQDGFIIRQTHTFCHDPIDCLRLRALEVDCRDTPILPPRPWPDRPEGTPTAAPLRPLFGPFGVDQNDGEAQVGQRDRNPVYQGWSKTLGPEI